MLREILETPLKVTRADGKLLYPKNYRIWDAIVQWLWPMHIVTLVHAGDMFSELVQDTHTIFRYVFRQPDQRQLLHNREWQNNPVEKFIEGYSASSIIREAERTYLQAAMPIFEYLQQSDEKILNNYPQSFQMVWKAAEHATKFWHSVGYFSVLIFACETTTNVCLLDSSEMARTIHAFNAHPEHPALQYCLSSIVDSVKERFVDQGFGAPVPLMAMFIGTMCDPGLTAVIPLFEAFIKLYRASKNATSWYVKDAVWATENDPQYADAVKAEQIPDAIKELTIFALESGTEQAIELLLPLYLDFGLPIEELPAAYIVYRSRFSPLRTQSLTLALMTIAHYPPEELIKAALTIPIARNKHIYHRDRMARVMTIQSIMSATSSAWLSKTVASTGFDTNPIWATRILSAFTKFETQDPQAQDALRLACDLDIGIATQMAILMVENDPQRDQIVRKNRSRIHKLLIQAIKYAKHDNAWKPVVLRLGGFIKNKLEEIANGLFRPVSVVKSRKKTSRIVMLPSPLSALLHHKLFDLIEPFCQNMTHVQDFGRAMFLYLLKQNQQACIPVLARCFGLQSLSITQLQEVCNRFETEKTIATIREFCPVDRLGLLLFKSMKLDHIREATLDVMRQRGFEPADVINVLLEKNGFVGSKVIVALAEHLYGQSFSADRVYKAFYEKDDRQLAALIRLYCPVMLYPMPQDLWESLPKVWSSAPKARKVFNKPPPNLLSAAIRYRRKETFAMLCTAFPEMIRLSCKTYKDCVCEACWLSETDTATKVLDLWPDADYAHLEESVLASVYQKLPHPSSSSD
ncbi:MAG: hypothetical protein CMP20_04890 [Rickettsiales bacterium]|nr:hypothetical protein [Rickettsiales bacterium]